MIWFILGLIIGIAIPFVIAGIGMYLGSNKKWRGL